MENLPILNITSDLRGLTLHGPWAWAIMNGYKRVENRSWETNYRGPIAIQVGNSRESDVRATDAFKKLGIEFPDSFLRGVILGTVELVDVLPLDQFLQEFGQVENDRAFALGPFCWVLRNPVLCRPFRCPGNFQLWNVANQLARLKR